MAPIIITILVALAYVGILHWRCAVLHTNIAVLTKQREDAIASADKKVNEHMLDAVRRGWGTLRADGHNKTGFDWKAVPTFFDLKNPGNVLSFSRLRKSRPVSLKLHDSDESPTKLLDIDLSAVSTVILGPKVDDAQPSPSCKAVVTFRDKTSLAVVLHGDGVVQLLNAAFVNEARS
jgi:hypothetical protein